LEKSDSASTCIVPLSRGGARGGQLDFGVNGRQWFGGNAGAGRVVEFRRAAPVFVGPAAREARYFGGIPSVISALSPFKTFCFASF
jgi:hypothetical protein